MVEADLFVRYHNLQKAWKQKSSDVASLLVELLTWKEEPLMIWAPLLTVDLPRLFTRKDSLLSLSDSCCLLRVLDSLESAIQNAEKREEKWKDRSQRTFTHSKQKQHTSSSSHSSADISHTHVSVQSWKRPAFGIYLSDDVVLTLKHQIGDLRACVLRSLTNAMAMSSGSGLSTPSLEDAQRKKGQPTRGTWKDPASFTFAL